MARIATKGRIQALLFLLMAFLASAQSPQCPNNLAVYNPNLRTMCVNGSAPSSQVSLLQSILIPSLQHSSLYLSTPPQSRAPSRPTTSCPFPRPIKRSFRTDFQQGSIPCLSKPTSRMTSVCQHCRSQHRYWVAVSRCRM